MLRVGHANHLAGEQPLARERLAVGGRARAIDELVAIERWVGVVETLAQIADHVLLGKEGM